MIALFRNYDIGMVSCAGGPRPRPTRRWRYGALPVAAVLVITGCTQDGRPAPATGGISIATTTSAAPPRIAGRAMVTDPSVPVALAASAGTVWIAAAGPTGRSGNADRLGHQRRARGGPVAARRRTSGHRRRGQCLGR